jgi:signal transduction histidine kinase
VPIPMPRRIKPMDEDSQIRAADRALLLERVAVGLAHEGKNPLHNMVLHLQLMAEKLAAGSGPVEKHLAAMRGGIGRVDDLLKDFGELAAPEHLPPDLGAAAQRAIHLLAYDARRAAVQVEARGPETLHVRSDGRWLGDLVAHALAASIALARDGGTVELEVLPQGAAATLNFRAQGGVGGREQALPHLEAARRLAADAACELSVETPPAGGARLSLHFLHAR